MDKGTLLKAVAAGEEERLTLARVLDKLEQCQRKNIPTATSFLTPQEQAGAEELLRRAGLGDCTALAQGGYPEAERRVLLFLPAWAEGPEIAEGYSPLRYLRATFRGDNAPGHRDILGSLMGLGITREMVGDILVSPESCDLMVLDTVADFLLQSWSSAGRIRLRVEEIGPGQLHIPAARTEELRDTVPSLRLDAVAAAGFRISRTRAGELIASGRVQVNWRECQKADRLLAEGDTISARGLGKFKLEQVGGLSRKGRTGIVLKRYV